jgi:hypothetical protein
LFLLTIHWIILYQKINLIGIYIVLQDCHKKMTDDEKTIVCFQKRMQDLLLDIATSDLPYTDKRHCRFQICMDALSGMNDLLEAYGMATMIKDEFKARYYERRS